MASLGKGALMPTSTRQKLNTRSSTETELVAADDMMPQIMWTNYFMDAQGYGLTQTILYQDNKSAILLEKNGKLSSSKRTKHVNIRYYFIKDRIANKELSVEYCPTEEMPADFFTKPLQGKLFFKFRKAIMNE
jgi:outer membrane protein W